MKMSKLSAPQIAFGKKKIKEAMSRWNVSEEQALKIFFDILWIKDHWNWNNMEDFLCFEMDSQSDRRN